MATLFKARIALALIAVSTVLSFSVWARAESEEDAVKVFKQLKPSVVSFKCGEGTGTGIVLQSDGLLLTNAHVVSSPMSYEVRIDAPTPNNPSATAAYKKVQILGYHPKLDLALVKIDPRENHLTLRPATLSNVKGETGQGVFVIGDPGAGGKVLVKSITSGMLSAVDRAFEGEKYYQTDAAINPGNSGGPMCDRTGKVLGLVTFKFMGVDAIGFAIPLHDLDIKSFVPLTKRKGDPKRAKELLAQGERYNKMADDIDAEARKTAKSKNGKNSSTPKFADPSVNPYRYFAAMCYHSAVTYDPANATIYYKVGMLFESVDFDKLRGKKPGGEEAADSDDDEKDKDGSKSKEKDKDNEKDKDKGKEKEKDKDKEKDKSEFADDAEETPEKLDIHAIAAAYVARAIQLAPLEFSGDSYQVLGAAMARLKQEDKAAVIWSEGVTKFPYVAATWESLAAFYSAHNRPVDCARCASTALLMLGNGPSAEVAKKLLEEAKSKVPASTTVSMEKQINSQALTSMLDRMTNASNAARKAKTLYINKPFATVIGSFGAVPAGDIAGNIKDEPLKPFASWLTDHKAALEAAKPPSLTVAVAKDLPEKLVQELRNTGNIVGVNPKVEQGYVVGPVTRGTQVLLTYVSGTWKCNGRVPSACPDEPLAGSRQVNLGIHSHLAIADGSKKPSAVLAVVPVQTSVKPFGWTADKDYKSVILRINDDDGDFATNPGQPVKYRMLLVPPE